MDNAIANKDWTGTDLWLHTTVAVIKPSFCTGGATCDFCQLLLYNVGDQDILYYP